MARNASKLGSAMAGGIAGALLACVVKGAIMGWGQMDSGFGWLSVPLDALTAPGLIIIDLMMLSAPAGVHQVVVLHWAALGFVVGAMAGYQSARPAASGNP